MRWVLLGSVVFAALACNVVLDLDRFREGDGADGGSGGTGGSLPELCVVSTLEGAAGVAFDGAGGNGSPADIDVVNDIALDLSSGLVVAVGRTDHAMATFDDGDRNASDGGGRERGFVARVTVGDPLGVEWNRLVNSDITDDRTWSIASMSAVTIAPGSPPTVWAAGRYRGRINVPLQNDVIDLGQGAEGIAIFGFAPDGTTTASLSLEAYATMQTAGEIRLTSIAYNDPDRLRVTGSFKGQLQPVVGSIPLESTDFDGFFGTIDLTGSPPTMTGVQTHAEDEAEVVGWAPGPDDDLVVATHDGLMALGGGMQGQSGQVAVTAVYNFGEGLGDLRTWSWSSDTSAVRATAMVREGDVLWLAGTFGGTLTGPGAERLAAGDEDVFVARVRLSEEGDADVWTAGVLGARQTQPRIALAPDGAATVAFTCQGDVWDTGRSLNDADNVCIWRIAPGDDGCPHTVAVFGGTGPQVTRAVTAFGQGQMWLGGSYGSPLDIGSGTMPPHADSAPRSYAARLPWP